jgi:hypothetical protein
VLCLFDASGGANGITVSAGVSDIIALARVTVAGFGTGGTGVRINSAAKVELKDVSISGNSIGLAFTPSIGVFSSHLYVFDSDISLSSSQNVLVAPTGSTWAGAVITRTKVHHGSSGLRADATLGGPVSVLIDDSVIGFHTNNGVAAVANGSGCPSSFSGNPATVLLERSVIPYTSSNGVNANGCGANIMSDSTMATQNGTGWLAQNAGAIFSFTNNAVTANGTNANTTSGGLSPLPPQ